jgi:hypothetical protein
VNLVFTESEELLTEPTSRPRTSAAIVAMSPALDAVAKHECAEVAEGALTIEIIETEESAG